jgi:hypothetical protein
MALKVGRGFFRLWIGLSVLWIGGVVTVTWSSVTTPAPWVSAPTTAPKPYVVVPPGAPKPGFDPDAFLRDTAPTPAPKEMTDEEFKAYGKPPLNLETIKGAAELALIPPALSLLFGLFVAWVIRGFRA